MQRKRFTISVTRKQEDILEKIMAEMDFNTLNEAVRYAIEMYEQKDNLTKDFLKIIDEKFGATNDRLRIGVRTAEQNSVHILNLLNTLTYKALYDDEGLIDTWDSPHKVLVESRNRLANMINKRKQVKDNEVVTRDRY